MATRAFGRGRMRKRVPTTLGRAPSANRIEPFDLSHIQKPIDTSIYGLSQVLTLFKTATDEVRRYIAYECDIIYECRTCRSLFRSLANFILHKRDYCQEIYEPIHKNKDAEVENGFYEIPSDSTNEEEVEQVAKTTKKLSDVLKKLTEKQENIKVSEEIAQKELLPEKSDTNDCQETKENNNKVYFEKIENSNVGVFQTIPNGSVGNDLMRSEVMEIHSILNNNEAILKQDGKIFSFHTEQNKSNPIKPKLTCPVCKLKFSTKKTLTYHIKYKHNETRLVYQCPECRDTFANVWCVFRHLYKVHRKTTTQVKKLRDIIHSTPIVKNQSESSASKEKLFNDSNTGDRENQWLNNLEGDIDLQMCGGCGKRFERKAALHSHSQTCMKRMAVCNSIKKTTEEKANKQKPQSNPVLKGSKRRKPTVLRKVVKPKDDIKSNVQRGTGSKESEKEQLTDVEMEKIQIEEVIFGNRENDPLEENKAEPIIILHSDDEDTFGFPSENEKEKSIEFDATLEKINDENTDFTENLLNTIEKNDLQSTDFVQLDINDKSDKTESNLEDIIDNNINNGPSEEENTEVKEFFSNIEIDLIVNGIPQNDPEVIVDLTEDCASDIDGDARIKISEVNETSSVSECSRTDVISSPLIVDEIPQTVPPKPTSPEPIKKVSRKRKRSTAKISLKTKSESYVNWELLQCNSCSISFKTNDCLMEHMALHFNWFRFQCSKCTFVSYDDKICLSHLQVEHNVDPTMSETCVTPLPNWKSLKLSSEFKSLESRIPKESETDQPSDIGKLNKEDPMVRKMIMEVIFGPDTAPPIPNEGKTSVSRSRNCVKTLDKDFVYDMNIVDTQIRKQVALENKVKPIKIIKNNECDFKVINVSPAQQKKKKCC